MKFIKTQTHGLINTAHVRRIEPNGDEKNPTLILHVNGEGPLTVVGNEALEVAKQLEDTPAAE
jgi:hypothetical protein